MSWELEGKRNLGITLPPTQEGQDTLPTYMLGQLRRVVTPEINAISTVLLMISVTMVIAYTLLSKVKK